MLDIQVMCHSHWIVVSEKSAPRAIMLYTHIRAIVYISRWWYGGIHRTRICCMTIFTFNCTRSADSSMCVHEEPNEENWKNFSCTWKMKMMNACIGIAEWLCKHWYCGLVFTHSFVFYFFLLLFRTHLLWCIRVCMFRH